MSMDWNTPGKVPPVLAGTAAHLPPLETWDPNGDVHLPEDEGARNYVPEIVRAPPQYPRPEQHPHRPEFPARQYERFFTNTTGLAGLSHQLGFTASSVRVDNYSSHWVYLQSAGMYVPPFIYGAIINLSPGVGVAGFTLSPPQGYSDPTPVLDSTVVTVWYEMEVANSPGVPIQSSFRVGAAGGAVVSGPLLFSPDNTYDIGASGANRPRNGYFAGSLSALLIQLIGGVLPGAFGGATLTTLWAGNGVPPAGGGSNGDYFFRSDTPTIANQRIYVKSAGAWVGIV